MQHFVGGWWSHSTQTSHMEAHGLFLMCSHHTLKMVSIFMTQDGAWGEADIMALSLWQKYTGCFPYTCILLSSGKILGEG